MKNDMEVVGEFEVKSGKLVVTDPCYDRDTWCMGALENVKKGKWTAFTTYEDDGRWGNRVANLVIVHESALKEVYDEQDVYEPQGFEVGVDSGQAGFFDDAAYPVGDRGEGGEYNKDEFYDECCHATVGEDSRSTKAKGTDSGIIRGAGVVSQSGYGDGGYTCFTRTNNAGEIVAARIEYIEPEDEEELEEDDFVEEDEEEEDDVVS